MTVVIIMVTKSAFEMARILPKRYEFRSILVPTFNELIMVPMASADAERIAMAASLWII